MKAPINTTVWMVGVVVALASVMALGAFAVGYALHSSDDAVASAAVAAPAEMVAGDNVGKAKAMIDKMVGQMEKMVGEVEAAGSDEAKVKAIGEKFKGQAEGMKAEGEALNKALTDAEKKTVEAYGKEKMGPIMGKLMAAMMKSQTAKCPGQAGMASEILVGTWEIDVDRYADLPHVRSLSSEGKAWAIQRVRQMAAKMRFDYTANQVTVSGAQTDVTEAYKVLRDGCDQCEIETPSSKHPTTIKIVDGGIVMGESDGAVPLRRRAEVVDAPAPPPSEVADAPAVEVVCDHIGAVVRTQARSHTGQQPPEAAIAQGVDECTRHMRPDGPNWSPQKPYRTAALCALKAQTVDGIDACGW